MSKQFGLTNDENEFISASNFREAAIADGWVPRPTYKNEPAESHATLEKDNFVMSVMARKNNGKYKYAAQVSIWGSDRLCIKAPKIYDHNDIFINGMKRCVPCGEIVDKTYKYSFAGRCCEKCLPEMRRTHEFPGWEK